MAARARRSRPGGSSLTRHPSPREALLLGALPHGDAVVGVGIDLCEIGRVREVLSRHGTRFLERVFVPGEVRRPPGSPAFAEHVAGLFAAKEAAMKALGTGMRGVSFREVAVAGEPGGPPRLVLLGRALARGEALGVRGAHVSITHGRETAAAVVLLLRGPDPGAGT